MLFVFEMLASWAIMIATCVFIVRRHMARKLAAFTAFIFVATAQQVLVGGYLMLTGDNQSYTSMQSWLSPIIGVLQACACIQAYAWLVMSLVNFKRIGAVLFVLLGLGSLAVEVVLPLYIASATPAQESLRLIEFRVGISLGAILMVSLFFFRIIGVPSAPKWHALSLALLSGGNGLGWFLMNGDLVMTSCITAFSVWCLTVHDAPRWINIPAEPYDAKGVERAWKEAEDKIRDSLSHGLDYV